MLESLVGVLLFYTMPNVLSRIGTLITYHQQVVPGLLPIVVAARQIYWRASASTSTERMYDGRR